MDRRVPGAIVARSFRRSHDTSETRMEGGMRVRLFLVSIPIAVLCWAGSPAAKDHSSAGLVQVTPLGSHTGELCRNDRALLFEDPTGLRILYDPGRTVDETDPR